MYDLYSQDFILKWIDEICENVIHENNYDVISRDHLNPHLKFLVDHKYDIVYIIDYSKTILDEVDRDILKLRDKINILIRINDISILYAFRLIDLYEEIPPILCSRNSHTQTLYFQLDRNAKKRYIVC